MLLSTQGLEFYGEPHLDGFSNAQATYMPDHSGKGRHLLSYNGGEPVNYNNQIAGRSVISWNGSNNALRNSSVITVQCGFLVLSITESTFSDYARILTDLGGKNILIGDQGSTNFYNLFYPGSIFELFEFRSNDRIYPQSAQPAPMNTYRIIFFRFWKPITMNGINVGQEPANGTRRARMNLALLALYSADNPYTCESDLRAAMRALAAAYGLTIQANVYPYQADKSDSSETIAQSVNIYDPPEGNRIAEVLGNPKRVLDLKFSFRRQDEVKAMKTFHSNYYPDVPCIYRNDKMLPPEDVEGYIDSLYELGGAGNNLNYGFRFKEK